MNARTHRILAVALILFCAGGFLMAQEPAVTGGASLSLNNQYVFRGYEYSSENGVIQPYLGITTRGFTFSFWGNIDLEEEATPSFVPDNPDHKSFNEADLTLSYTRSFGKLALTAGWVYYGTQYATETQELWLGAAYDVPTKPTLTVYRDIDAYPGTYVNLAFSHSLTLTEAMTLDMAASAGYFMGDGDYWRTYDPDAAAYAGEQYQAMHDGMLKAGLTVPLGAGVSLQPVVQYYFPLSGDAGRVTDGASHNPGGRLDDTVVYGATIILAF